MPSLPLPEKEGILLLVNVLFLEEKGGIWPTTVTTSVPRSPG